MNDLLISTMNGLILWQDSEARLVAHGTYYGLTWDKEFVYASFNPQHRNVTEIEVFNHELYRIGRLDTVELHGVHQIFSWKDNLYIVNTSTDHIEVINGNKAQRFSWTGFNEDRHHLNSIWMDQDYIYVAEGQTTGLKGTPAIQTLTHNYKPANRFILPATVQIHNVYVENETLYTCGKFGLVKKSLREKRYNVIDLRLDDANGFLRGLAKSEDCFYIGESQVRPREQRPYGDSRILVLNNDLEIIRTIELQDTGQIHDVRIINDVDYAHNRFVLEYQYPFKKITLPLISDKGKITTPSPTKKSEPPKKRRSPARLLPRMESKPDKEPKKQKRSIPLRKR